MGPDFWVMNTLNLGHEQTATQTLVAFEETLNLKGVAHARNHVRLLQIHKTYVKA